MRPVIQLLSVAGSNHDLPAQLGCDSSAAMIAWVQELVGPGYRVRANRKLIDARVDPTRCGRRDDRARAADIQRALSDDRVISLVSLRGGSWLTRILPLISFEQVRKRRVPLHVFGFSELTTLVNILASYKTVRAHYDLGPGFLFAGLRAAARRAGPGQLGPHQATAWAAERFAPEFAEFFKDVLRIIAGQPSARPVLGTWMGPGAPPDTLTAFGGCLAVLVGMLGTPYQKLLRPRGRWLAIEDLREEPYRMDRYLAQLQLAGILGQCSGILLGDFHTGSEDQTDAVLALLKMHLRGRRVPIIARCNFGHVFPMASLPIGRPLAVVRSSSRQRTVTLSGAPQR